MSEQDAVNEELAAEAVGLHSLKPAPGSKKDRKRVGRGHGSGHGKTSGRGHKDGISPSNSTSPPMNWLQHRCQTRRKFDRRHGEDRREPNTRT